MFVNLIYKLIPRKILYNKKFRKTIFGYNKGVSFYSQLFLKQYLGLYEYKLSNNIIKYCKNPDTILVVGMHNGYTAIKLSKIYPNSKVIGVEANPVLCSDTLKTINYNNIGNVSVVFNAIGYKDTLFQLNGDESSMISPYSKSKKIKSYKKNLININPVTTLKNIISKSSINKKNTNVLLLDIEGFEDDIISHEDLIIFDNFKYIILEWHSLSIKKKYLEHLKEKFKIIEIDKGFLTNNSGNNGHLIFVKN